MTHAFGPAPSLEDFARLGQAAIARLPDAFRAQVGAIAFAVEDFADAPTLASVGLEEPFDLTGIYEGLPLTERSIEHSGTLPDRIRLFRRPILDEWAERGDVTLEELVQHVVVHEIGHHFGFSDDDMHALEDMAG